MRRKKKQSPWPLLIAIAVLGIALWVLLARVVQDSLNGAINAGNEKHPKQIPGTIYLMKHVTAPAILVECGFLSNTEETVKLQDPSYQMKLATAITTGYLRCLAGEEVA